MDIYQAAQSTNMNNYLSFSKGNGSIKWMEGHHGEKKGVGFLSGGISVVSNWPESGK